VTDEATQSDEVLVVGGGVAGVACARLLHDTGVPVVVRDRGRRLGGRMAVRTVAGRPIDIGAAYFTVSHPAFGATVQEWQEAGLAYPWTDTFHVATPDGLLGTTTGPMRFAAPLGLRSLVEAMAVGLPVSNNDEVRSVGPGPIVDGQPYAAVVLAMPGPQARDILSDELSAERAEADHMWEPAISLIARYRERTWPDVDGVFVNDSPLLTYIADDGRRRGDGEAVLVAHSTPLLAAAHLDEPQRVQEAMLDELSTVLGIGGPPEDVFVKRWSLAKPLRAADAPFHLGSAHVGLCGDGWHGAPKIESAFLSGQAVARAVARSLGFTPPAGHAELR
jgi:renalase